jgi:hypothetical protein
MFALTVMPAPNFIAWSLLFFCAALVFLCWIPKLQPSLQASLQDAGIASEQAE